MADGLIFDIREFTIHDGPGIRITVFFKGCPLRCLWCHNPEGLSFQPELMIRKSSCRNCGTCMQPCTHEECQPFDRCTRICPDGLIHITGRKINPEVLAAELKQHGEFLDHNGGGITLSGGEPLAQPEFLLELLQALKPMHTVLETSGWGDNDVFRQAILLADLTLFDIKHMNPEIHKTLTGVDNGLIHKNLDRLIQSGREFVVRIPLIPGVNDDRENMEEAARYLAGATGLQQVELLPCNPLAGAKYSMVGRQYRPSFDESLEPRIYTEVFHARGIRCFVV